MFRRIVEITDDNVHLSKDRGCMVVEYKGGKKHKLALQDIAAVVANSYSLTYTNNIVVALAEDNVVATTCLWR